MPDIRLRQPRLGERRTHARRLPGGVPGTMLAQVVRVGAVAHDGESAAPRRRDEPAPQLRLAEEATVRRIREIVGILELVRVELDQRDIEAPRHRPRRRPLGRRVGGASTHARQHPLASQLLPQHDGQQGRIDPARVADEGRWIGPDEGAQLGGWCLGSGHGGIVAAYTGYITGYGARVDRAKAGFPVTAFVAVRYSKSDYVGDEPRMREMEKHPGVLECHHVAGEDCYVLKVAAPDLERLQDLLRDLRGPSPTVEMNTRTTIVLGTVFEKPGFVPTELD